MMRSSNESSQDGGDRQRDEVFPGDVGGDSLADASTTSGLSWSEITDSSKEKHGAPLDGDNQTSPLRQQSAALYSTNNRNYTAHMRHLPNSDRALPKLPSTRSRSSSQSVLEGLSINKLNFHKVHLHGREAETQQLLSIWNELCKVEDQKQKRKDMENISNQRSRNDTETATSVIETTARTNCKHLTFVDGLSGVGKSCLITSVLQSAAQSRGFFVTGKFDLKNIHIPLGGIIMAINDWCDQVLAMYLQINTSDSNRSSFIGTSNTTASSKVSLVLSTSQRSYSSNRKIEIGDIKKVILGELGQELPYLVTIFPKLLSIVGDDYSADGGTGSVLDGSIVVDDSDDANNQKLDVEFEKAKNRERLKFCVKKLIRMLCSCCPLVLFLDDAQWSDNESMDVLYQILTDYNNEGVLMVVCACRSDEVSINTTHHSEHEDDHPNSHHPMNTLLKKTKELQKTPDPVTTNQITIGNLSVDDLTAFLLDLLASDSTPSLQQETKNLAGVLHEKTNGNIFFVVQLLMSLNEKGYLAYNLGLMRWVWDAQEIKENSPAADNVVQLVQEKLEEDSVARQLLPVAACLGSVFDTSTLNLVIDGLRKSLETERSFGNDPNHIVLRSFLSLDFDVHETLEVCCREGYISRTSGTNAVYGFTFVHDRVQEAAIKVVPKNVQAHLKHYVGQILAAELLEEDLATMVFTILGLLSDDLTPQTNEARLSFLKLNMLAGEKAMSYAAFKPASEYFEKAVNLLPDNAWSSQYSLTFGVYLAVSEAYLCLANFNRMNHYCDQVLAMDFVRPVDKLRISNVIMDSLVAQNNAKQSIDVGLGALAACGCKFPRGKLRTGFASAAGLMRIKFSKKMQNADNILSLPFSSDATHSIVMNTLDKLATAAFIAADEARFPLVIIKSIQLSFERGITIYSPAAFALVGLLLTNFIDDSVAGWNYCRNALIMLKRLKCKEIESRTIFLAYTYTAHWTKPVQDCMRPLIKAYKAGLSSGDVMNAMYSVFFYCEFQCYTGASLVDVEKNCAVYGNQMKEFGQMNSLLAFNMVHQMVLILLGRVDGNTGQGAILTGDVMDQESVLKQLKEADDQFLTSTLHRYRIILACYVGDHETGATVASEWAEIALKLLPGQPTNMIVRFCSALSCYAYYRSSGKKKYLKEGKRHHKIIRRWAERTNGHNPNAVHREVLLSAELDACAGKARSAYTKFESAILMAGRRGIVQDQALANERFAIYCSERNDVEEATYRMKSAVALYAEWGASTKAESLSKTTHATRRLSKKYPPIVGTTVQLQEQPSGHILNDETSSHILSVEGSSTRHR